MNEMTNFNLAFFYELDEQGNKIYSLQASCVFEDLIYDKNGSEIIQEPPIPGGTLHIKLYLKTGSSSHIVHDDIILGTFPSTIGSWKIHFQYLNENGEVKGEVRTEQTEAEAEPKPLPIKIE